MVLIVISQKLNLRMRVQHLYKHTCMVMVVTKARQICKKRWENS